MTVHDRHSMKFVLLEWFNDTCWSLTQVGTYKECQLAYEQMLRQGRKSDDLVIFKLGCPEGGDDIDKPKPTKGNLHCNSTPSPHAGTIQELGYDDLSKRISDLAVRLTQLEGRWTDLDRRFVRTMRTLRTAAHNAEGTPADE